MFASLKVRADHFGIEAQKIVKTPSSFMEQLDLNQLIENGENEQVEFMASLFYDIMRKQYNKNLYYKTGKAIAGMLNKDGGLLVIGVREDKSIIGIEEDFRFLGNRNKTRPSAWKRDTDGYQLKLVDLVIGNLGAELLGNINFSFEEIDNHLICIVSVQPNSKPVFFGKVQDFFIRSGVSTFRLNPKSTLDYVKEHWKGIA